MVQLVDQNASVFRVLLSSLLESETEIAWHSEIISKRHGNTGAAGDDILMHDWWWSEVVTLSECSVLICFKNPNPSGNPNPRPLSRESYLNLQKSYLHKYVIKYYYI